ncbi:MAG: hypothetical protein ACFFBP_14855 [Promethearchaeota archaeon]
MFLDLSITGWLDGITSTAIIASALVFGLLSIIKGVKNNTRLLVIAGIQVMIIGSYYLGPFVDFMFYGIFSLHIIPELYPLLSYSQVFLGITTVAILGGELITPNYKQAVVGAMSALGMMLFALIYIWVWAMAYNVPYLEVLAGINPAFAALGAYAPWNPFHITPGTYGFPAELIDATFSPWNPAMMLIWIMQFFVLIFMGGGFLIKAKQSTGNLRGKFIILAIAFILFFLSGITDSLISQVIDARIGLPISKTIARIVQCWFGLLIYLGLRP